MSEVVERIKQRLMTELQATDVEVIDQSHLHANHAEAIRSGGGHYVVKVTSSQFAGKSRIDNHRMIYKALEEDFADIHALSIQTAVP